MIQKKKGTLLIKKFVQVQENENNLVSLAEVMHVNECKSSKSIANTHL